MNNREVVKQISVRSGVSPEICEEVVKGYEKYCEKNITHSSRKYLDDIAAFILQDRGIEEKVTENVITQLFDLLKEETKKKIPFIK